MVIDSNQNKNENTQNETRDLNENTLNDLTISNITKEEKTIAIKKLSKLEKNKSKDIFFNDEDLISLENKLLSKREQSLIVQEYFKRRFWKEISHIMLAAFLTTIAFDYLITVTGRSGLFPAGLGALARFFAIATFPDNQSLQSSFYFVYYFAINIPMFVFGIIKLGKKFTFTTFLYVLFQIGFDQTVSHLPVVNPTNFHFIVNIQLVNAVSTSWNSAIWLFLFGAIGGLMLGTSYSFVYKIGSSTGGSDFVTIYFSRKFSKPVGSINRNVNLVILGVIIIANTALLPMSYISPDIKIQVLNMYTDNELLASSGFTKSDSSLIKSIIEWHANHGGIIKTFDSNNGQPIYFIDETFKSFLGIRLVDFEENKTFEQFFKLISKKASGIQNISQEFKTYLFENVSKSGYGDDLASTKIFFMKMAFIFGPSLFASVILVLCSGLATNALYPRYKVRTYLITTNAAKEVNKMLLDSGFENDIVTWDGTNRINGNYLYRSVIMVAMSVMDWENIEKQIFIHDAYAKINIIKTKHVKGFFNYNLKTNDQREVIKNNIQKDQQEMDKIHQIARAKINKEQQKIKNKDRYQSKKTEKNN